MKYLFIIYALLLPLALSANHELQNADTLFVWAQSGLRVRDTPSPDGEILDKLSFGSIVHLLEKVNDNSVPYEVIAETTMKEWEEKPLKKGVFKLKGHWVKIGYGKKTGYVFDQYLSRLKPLTDEVLKQHEKKFKGIGRQWLETFMFINFGEKLSRKTTKLDEWRELHVYKYPRKAMYSDRDENGGVMTTITLPQGFNFVEGYLIFRSLYPDESSFLLSVKPNLIKFVTGYGEGSVKLTNGVITITFDAWT